MIRLSNEQRTRMRESQDVWLSTVRPNLGAHLVPIWAVLVDDVVYMGTGRNSQKARNIAAHPRAVPDTRNVLIFEGRIRILSGKPPDGVMERFHAKQYK